MKKITIIIILIITITSVVYSSEIETDTREHTFDYYGREEGLSNLAVSQIIQDKDGYLWIGTQGGLNRFDGHTFKVFRSDPHKEDGLVHNLIQTMYYDELEHELWIGTYQGVSVYEIEKDEFRNYIVDDFLPDVVVAITKDNSRNVWIGGIGGVTRMDVRGHKTDFLQDETIRKIHIADDGRIYFGTYTGLYVLDYDTDTVIPVDIELPSTYVMDIVEFESGTLVLGVWNAGLIYYDYNQNVVKHLSLSNNNVYKVYETSDDVTWVATWGGGLLGVREFEEYYAYSSLNSVLQNDNIYSMLEDQSGIFWIGTNGGGLYQTNPERRNHLIYSSSVDESTITKGRIRELYQDNRDNLWVAIDNKGLDLINSFGDITHFTYDERDSSSIHNNYVDEIVYFDDEHLLLGTGAGLSKVNLITYKFEAMNIIPGNPLISGLNIIDNEIWAGTYGEGLYVYNLSSGNLRHYTSENNELTDDIIYDITIDSHNRIWVGTNNGLNLLIDGSVSFRHLKPSKEITDLANGSVSVIFEDQQGIIWIGTDGGGLAKYLGESAFKTYTELDGLASNSIVSILEDDANRLLIATDNGISMFDKITEQFINFTPEDGIGAWEFTNGAYKRSNGELLFTSFNGITSMDNKFTKDKTFKPLLYITDVNINEAPYSEEIYHYNNEFLSLNHNENSLQIDFVAIEYDNPEKHSYIYRLRGYDEQWHRVSNTHEAVYPNLPSGDYTFEIYAETASKVSSDIVTITIEIKKHWTQSIYAYLLYALVLYLIFRAILRYRELKIVSKKNDELAVLNQKLEDANVELENMSIHDPLTNIFNRRYFTAELNEKIHIAMRSNTFVSLMMIDLDDFKNINDEYGHVSGDHVLKEVADVLKVALPRKTDFVSRFGGDEFAIVLYDTDLEGTLKVANRIVDLVRNVHVRNNSGLPVMPMTVSVGVFSHIPISDTTVEHMVREADDALYLAKEKGKNTVMYK
jgi:diguanylate cyclase (GGDEF)-like protein